MAQCGRASPLACLGKIERREGLDVPNGFPGAVFHPIAPSRGWVVQSESVPLVRISSSPPSSLDLFSLSGFFPKLRENCRQIAKAAPKANRGELGQEQVSEVSGRFSPTPTHAVRFRGAAKLYREFESTMKNVLRVRIHYCPPKSLRGSYLWFISSRNPRISAETGRFCANVHVGESLSPSRAAGQPSFSPHPSWPVRFVAGCRQPVLAWRSQHPSGSGAPPFNVEATEKL
jgi:hypothetical protein